MQKSTCSLGRFTYNLFPGKNQFSVLTSVTEQVHYRKIVTTLQCISLSWQESWKKKKWFSCAEIDMHRRTMPCRSCNVFQQIYRSKLDKKRINKINSSVENLKIHFFPICHERKWAFARLSIVFGPNAVDLLPYLSKWNNNL